MSSNTKLMQSFPPAADEQVNLGNWRTPPFNRWAYSHTSEIVPSALIFNGEKVCRLPENLREIEGFSIEHDGKTLSLQDWLVDTFTDGLLVLKNGEVVYEHYFGELKRHVPHIFMSISKSLTALVAGVLAGKGILDVNRRVDEIIPEVAQSAYQGATVRDLLDMRVGVEFDENYLASDGKIIEYRKAQNWNPLQPGDSARNLREFFPILIETDGEHTQRFHYASPNTDLLGWVLERVSGKRFADLVTEYIWQPLGAEYNAYITVDRTGAPRCAGGVCATTRDLAKLGRLFATGGKAADGTQVIPESWLQDILAGSDELKAAWDTGDFYDFYNQASMHYRSKWYVEHGENKMVFGLGVFGQNVFVEPDHDLVIVKFSSQPLPLDQDFNTLTHKGIDCLRSLLR